MATKKQLTTTRAAIEAGLNRLHRLRHEATESGDDTEWSQGVASFNTTFEFEAEGNTTEAAHNAAVKAGWTALRDIDAKLGS